MSFSRIPVLLLSAVIGSLGLPAGAEEPPTRFPAAARVVAVGDVHGDLAATRRALRLAGVLDEEDRWSGGETVLVQTGDQLDRGDDEREILALFDRLAREAAEAGGAVHVLNGNHEYMNVKGDFRYVTREGYEDFQDVPDLDLAAPELARLPAAKRARRAAFLPGGPSARLLARRNTVVIVGETVYLHGGVLPEVAEYGLERLNAEARRWLRGEGPEPEILLRRDGPVWSRHYSDAPGRRDCRLLAQALRLLGAARMVVGHTVQEEGISPACGGRVWRIDVGMTAAYGSHPPEVLEIAEGAVQVLHEGPR